MSQPRADVHVPEDSVRVSPGILCDGSVVGAEESVGKLSTIVSHLVLVAVVQSFILC